jgi:hypothetical protein
MIFIIIREDILYLKQIDYYIDPCDMKISPRRHLNSSANNAIIVKLSTIIPLNRAYNPYLPWVIEINNYKYLIPYS